MSENNDYTNNNVNNGGDSERENVCSICLRSESSCGKLMKMPPGIFICNDCMQKTFDMMNNSPFSQGDISQMGQPMMFNLGPIPEVPESQRVKKKEAKKKEALPELDLRSLPAPHIIKAKLDEYVIGQERAKKIVSVAVYNHYKRVIEEKRTEKERGGYENGMFNEQSSEVEIEKSNMLMIGPTGSGKTYLVKTLAKLLNVPLAMTDATSLTEAGYIGDDVESVLSKLLKEADNDVELAERGIVFIDEIDKLAKKKNATTRDVSGESVQQALLRLIEGGDVDVPVGATNKNAMVPMTTISTRHILFICGGAFPDLPEIIRSRLNKTSLMGFNSELKDKYDNDEDILSKVETEDLRQYGMIPEFLGRLPVVYSLKGLDREALKVIMTKPKNAILRQYKKLFEIDSVELKFDDDALDLIADRAMEKKTGARALRAIIEEFMLDIMYEIPKDPNIGSVTITKDYIEGKGAPIIGFRG